MDIEKYRGVIPAFYACYDEAGQVSGERTRALARPMRMQANSSSSTAMVFFILSSKALVSSFCLLYTSDAADD